MTTSLLRFAFIATLLAIALFSFAQRPLATHAEGSTDNVQDIDLARMVLPLSAFGPSYAEFQKNPRNAHYAMGDNLAQHESGAYMLFFNSPDNGRLAKGAAAAGSTVLLLDSAQNIALVIDDSLTEYRQLVDEHHGTYSTFDVPGLASAIGIEAIIPPLFSGDTLYETALLFPIGNLIGGVAFISFNDANLESDATTAANALADRMKGVLTGKITDFPAPLPPDVNCNGDVNSIDASLVLQLGAGLVALLPCDALADANQDGRTNAIDASLILQYSAGLIDSLPVS